MSENELDRLLQDWAARHELSAARLEAIRAIPHTVTTELSRRWWKELFRGMTETLRESTDPRRYHTPLPDAS